MNRRVQLQQAIDVLQSRGVALTNADIVDTTHYLTFNAKGKGSLVKLIDSNTRKLEGTTSFDSNKLNKGRYLVIDGIRVLTDTTTEKTGEAKWESEADKAIVNSELEINQDGTLLKIPASDILSKLGKYEEGGFRTISTAPTIVPDVAFEFNWIFPNGVTVPATDNLVRIEIRVIEVFER